jgi:hypothetical protein
MAAGPRSSRRAAAASLPLHRCRRRSRRYPPVVRLALATRGHLPGNRAHLGVETQRQWSDLAIMRTTPPPLGLFSLVTLWAHDLATDRPTVAAIVTLARIVPARSSSTTSLRSVPLSVHPGAFYGVSPERWSRSRSRLNQSPIDGVPQCGSPSPCDGDRPIINAKNRGTGRAHLRHVGDCSAHGPGSMVPHLREASSSLHTKREVYRWMPWGRLAT